VAAVVVADLGADLAARAASGVDVHTSPGAQGPHGLLELAGGGPWAAAPAPTSAAMMVPVIVPRPPGMPACRRGRCRVGAQEHDDRTVVVAFSKWMCACAALSPELNVSE
jgi:hypothetical protein